MTNETAKPQAFGDRLFSDTAHAYQVGQETADVNGAPVVILSRDGWLAVCEEPPEDMPDDPLSNGWELEALIEPRAWADAEQEVDEAYERAAHRASMNDFEDTGGKDWT